MYLTCKRLFDIVLALTLIILSAPILFILYPICKITDPGPFLNWSRRVGINSTIFLMPKIRTMKITTPQVATHLLTDSKSYITPLGSFLRKASLDEIPQLYSILKGDMSFVGPRPALFNQYDLMQMRANAGVDKLQPGLTGWAQINGRDEISLEKKVSLEKDYLNTRNFYFDCKIIFWTFLKVLRQNNISH